MVEGAQLRSRRCPLTVEITAMTSTRMIAFITAPQDTHLVLMNLRTLQPGASKMGPHPTTTIPATTTTTVTNPSGKTGTLGENGGISHHLPPTHRGMTSTIPIQITLGVTRITMIHTQPRLDATTTEIHLDLLLDCQQHHVPNPNLLRRSRSHTMAPQGSIPKLHTPPVTVPNMNRTTAPCQPRQSPQVTSRYHSKMIPAGTGSKSPFGLNHKRRC